MEEREIHSKKIKMKKLIISILFIILFSCKNDDISPVDPYKPFIGYWEFVKCTVIENNVNYVHNKGCDFNDIPIQFYSSVFEFDIEFVNYTDFNLISTCNLGGRYLYYWEFKNKEIRLIDGNQVFKLSVVKIDSNNLQLSLLDFPFEPIMEFKRK